ncbi:hypothetical protein SADUNF_Sadunf19G0025900 [Salix dunnii]|uniref:Uncharacterized protein n=1 Tax=Salix dunnii TaxID=1413687 RepID=A0A835J061_9ROSI|nr:hypothetical protein SADUNF_Sadunf19G0025900 [Salix dunnii]
MSTTCHLSATEGTKFSDPTLYRQVVGSLQYLAFTRPDLSFAIHRVSKFMHEPLEPHWQAVKRILRFLKHTISTGLLIRPSSTFDLQAFSDSDWAGDRDDRRSISAYCVFIGPNLVSWRCKQQATVARSSTEAEYKSLADTASEIKWLQSLLSEIGLQFPSPPVLCPSLNALFVPQASLWQTLKEEASQHPYMVRIGKLATANPGAPYKWMNGLVCYNNQVVIPPSSPLVQLLL